MKGLLIAAALVLAGCSTQATMPMAQQSWHDFGYQQAMDGMAKQINATLDVDQSTYGEYSDGYELGRSEFCQQDAFHLGLIGHRYQGICASDPAFHDEYQEGLWWDDGASLD
ncbi:DUF2799 domain-containing protein [Vibrio sp. AK197]|uniref:DUF2799 domain-containing protein n=1 Tax=Vibrio olivae TaxID=1243002 RepID=A0ABV5HTJ5_9VIBR